MTLITNCGRYRCHRRAVQQQPASSHCLSRICSACTGAVSSLSGGLVIVIDFNINRHQWLAGGSVHAVIAVNSDASSQPLMSEPTMSARSCSPPIMTCICTSIDVDDVYIAMHLDWSTCSKGQRTITHIIICNFPKVTSCSQCLLTC